MTICPWTSFRDVIGCEECEQLQKKHDWLIDARKCGRYEPAKPIKPVGVLESKVGGDIMVALIITGIVLTALAGAGVVAFFKM